MGHDMENKETELKETEYTYVILHNNITQRWQHPCNGFVDIIVKHYLERKATFLRIDATGNVWKGQLDIDFTGVIWKPI